MAGDVIFKDCWLRLKLDGAAGTREVVDSSYLNRRVYNGAASLADVQFSTEQVKHLSTSLKLLQQFQFTMGPHVPPLIAPQAFCIRFWVYPTNAGGNLQKGLFGFSNAVGDFICRETSANRLGIVFIKNNVLTTLNSTTTGLTNNAWNHIAICWDGTTIRLFKNGAVIASVAAASSNSTIHICDNPTGTHRIGLNAVDPNPVQGYYSDIEIYNNRFPYTGTFTPPTSAEVDYYRVINGTISESEAIVKWRVCAYEWISGAMVGAGYSNGTTYKVKVITDKLCYVTLTPVIDLFKVADSSQEIKPIGATLAPDDAHTNPHLWVNNLNSNLFYLNNSAASLVAPSSHTDGGGNVWDYLGPLVQPVTQGPLLPVDE